MPTLTCIKCNYSTSGTLKDGIDFLTKSTKDKVYEKKCPECKKGIMWILDKKKREKWLKKAKNHKENLNTENNVSISYVTDKKIEFNNGAFIEYN